jgi:hypothetical protein
VRVCVCVPGPDREVNPVPKENSSSLSSHPSEKGNRLPHTYLTLPRERYRARVFLSSLQRHPGDGQLIGRYPRSRLSHIDSRVPFFFLSLPFFFLAVRSGHAGTHRIATYAHAHTRKHTSPYHSSASSPPPPPPRFACLSASPARRGKELPSCDRSTIGLRCCCSADLACSFYARC